MKKALKKFILITLIILIALTFASVSNYAATGSFSVSTSSVTLNKGETTSFTITATNCGGQFTITSSNSNVASVSKSEVWAENGVNEGGAITITANSAGTATITITANNVSTTNPPSEVTGSKTINVTVTEPAPEPEPTPEPTPDPEPERPNTGSENQGGEQQTGETTTSKLTSIMIDGVKYENDDDLTVENDVSTVNVIAGNNKANYTITVNGNSVFGNKVNLNEGRNTIVVTDLDGGGSIKVKIDRKAPEGETPPNVMDNTEVSENTVDEETAEDSGLKLEKLTIEGLELIPEFDPDIYSYTVNINMDEQDYSSLNIDAVANDYMASVGIDGNQNLQEGENIINIILTSADGEEIVTYQLIVNKITSASEVVGETTNEDNNQKMPIIIAIVAIIVIVIIVAIIVLIRKYKKMNPDYDEYDGYGLYNYDLYNNPNDDNENNNEDTQNYENDNVYKFEDSEEEKQETNTYNEYNDYNDDFDGGKKKRRRGKGKHA